MACGAGRNAFTVGALSKVKHKNKFLYHFSNNRAIIWLIVFVRYMLDRRNVYTIILKEYLEQE
ncbi:hypothetical protein [Ectobacillus antri]|jgi:hypothetical protein|uniref:hypothetical protein n=1 Tax=Ectobacillus antri TaxID=2486280 RepID=UPI0013DE4ECA|nr:hypothetical protein [Ectobacillus antri]